MIFDLKTVWFRNAQKHQIKLVGEVLSYPSNLIMPFTLSGIEEGSINFSLRVIEKENPENYSG